MTNKNQYLFSTNPLFLELPQLQPTYVNMTELATMAASKITNSNNTNNVVVTQQSVQQPTHSPPPTTASMCPVTQSLIQTQAQPNSPALSTTSSLVSPDSSATNPVSSVSSPDMSGGIQTPQNTPQSDSPQTPLVPGTTNNDNMDDVDKSVTSSAIEDKSASTTPTNSSPVTTARSATNNNNSKDNNSTTAITNNQETFSPKKDSCIENDIKSSGSVLEKASMFDKLEKLQAAEAKALAQAAISSSCTSLNTQNFTLPPSINTNLTPATVARLESIYGKRQEEKVVVVEKDAG